MLNGSDCWVVDRRIGQSLSVTKIRMIRFFAVDYFFIYQLDFPNSFCTRFKVIIKINFDKKKIMFDPYLKLGPQGHLTI